MIEQEDTRRKSRRDLLLILLILPLGVLCMFATGQAAIRLAPAWLLNADMRSLLDPNAQFAAGGNQLFIEPLDPGILTLPAWGDLFLTPNVVVPTRLISTATLPPPARTSQPPPVRNTPEDEPTATVVGPIVIPTRVGPPQADLVIELSDISSTYTPGASISYTINISNLGPDNAPRFNVIDNIPAVISGLTVACTPADLCGTNTSSGNTVSFTGANLPYSGGVNQITLSISGIVASGATGDLSNTVQIVIPANARYQDPNLSNNTITDTDTQLSIYDLAITKNDGSSTFTANNPITYTIVVTNSGPSDALGVRVVDNKPAQVATWTWTCTTVTNAGGCSGVTNSTSNFTDTVNIRLGGRIEYTVTANPAGIPQYISNTASIVLRGSPSFIDPNMSNNSATDINIPSIDLQITKTDAGATYAANGSVPYTVTVTNNSTFNLTGITISDSKPPQVTTWEWCVVSSCTGPIDTDFSDTINLTAGSSLVYTVTANISGTAGMGNITNTAIVSAPAGLVDANTANNSATEITPPNIDLQITKTDNSLTYTPGGALQYIVSVTNASTFDLTGVTVTDNMPALIDPSTWTWTCAPDPGASCTPGPSNTNINDSAVSLPSGGSVTYTIDAIVNDFAAGTLENTTTVSPPTGLTDAVPGNNTATDSNVSAAGEPDIGPPDGNIYNIPDGGTASFFMSQPIIANGDPGADFVFYELPMGPGIDLDQVIIQISAEGSNWYSVFSWGDTIADTNTNVDNVNIPNIASTCPTEIDNCTIASGDLYNNTGIRIDVDNSPLSTGLPLGNYYWIRFIEPNLPTSDMDDTHVDAIEILP